MPRDPVPRDVHAPAHPDPVVPFDVIEKTEQSRKPAGPPQKPAMHADGEHLRVLRALGVQDIESVAQIGEELLAGIEALRGGEPHVVGVEGVRDDEVRVRYDRLPW